MSAPTAEEIALALVTVGADDDDPSRHVVVIGLEQEGFMVTHPRGVEIDSAEAIAGAWRGMLARALTAYGDARVAAERERCLAACKEIEQRYAAMGFDPDPGCRRNEYLMERYVGRSNGATECIRALRAGGGA